MNDRKEMNRQHQMSFPNQQRGAVLLVGLVMLLIVTLIGVSSMQTVTLDEKIVSNMQNATLAYHGAEAGLSGCESNVQEGIGDVYTLGSFPSGWREDYSGFWKVAGFPTTFTGLDPNAPPTCVVEYVGDGGSDVDVKEFYKADNPSSRPTFRVSSYSKGGDAHVEAMVESVFVCPGGCVSVSAKAYSSSP